MKNKVALIEHGKSLLIFLLLISAVFLLLKATLYQPDAIIGRLSAFFGAEPVASVAEQGTAQSAESAASPRIVLVTTEDGSHYCAKFDSANREKLISQFSSYLGMALGSANTPVQITEEDWRAALKQSGVYFDYIYPQPLSAVASWLGTTLSGEAGEHMARRLYLGSYRDVLCLYYIDENDYAIYRCNTALSFSALAVKLSELPTGGAAFAFEQGESYNALDPYFILSEENTQLRAMSASNPLKDSAATTELLELFGMSSRTTRSVLTNDGSAVYVDGEKSLSLGVSGKLSFTVTEGEGLYVAKSGSELSIGDCIALANSIAQQSIGSMCGEATIGLIGISNPDIPASCTLYFGYFIDGVPVQLSGGASALRAQISSGAVVRVDMVYRSYAYTGEALLPLPEKQACAIASLTGGEPLLRYEDKSDGMSAQWVRN